MKTVPSGCKAHACSSAESRHCQEQVRTSQGDAGVCFVFLLSGWNQALDHLSWLKSCFPKEAAGFFFFFFFLLTKKEMMHQDRLDWLSWENDKLNPLYAVWIMLLSLTKSPTGYYDVLWLWFSTLIFELYQVTSKTHGVSLEVLGLFFFSNCASSDI